MENGFLHLGNGSTVFLGDEVQARTGRHEILVMLLDLNHTTKLLIIDADFLESVLTLFLGIIPIPCSIGIVGALFQEVSCILWGKLRHHVEDAEDVPKVSIHLQNTELVLHSHSARDDWRASKPLEERALRTVDPSVVDFPVVPEAVHSQTYAAMAKAIVWRLVPDVKDSTVSDNDHVYYSVEGCNKIVVTTTRKDDKEAHGERG
mmetsp:Transcript_48414/g.122106  ORF Transcript_48414/g.122106 Transcript_48414/m.122106 type:complete len:205 (+) Transcript_48414:774-1388(+)